MAGRLVLAVINTVIYVLTFTHLNLLMAGARFQADFSQVGINIRKAKHGVGGMGGGGRAVGRRGGEAGG